MGTPASVGQGAPGTTFQPAIEWRDGTLERPGWFILYRPAGGSLRSVGASATVAAKHSAGWFALSRSEPARSLDARSRIVAQIIQKILHRGAAPPIDPAAEDRLLSILGLKDRVEPAALRGDISVRLVDPPGKERLEAAFSHAEPTFRPDPRLPFGSDAERSFLTEWVPKNLGPSAGRWFLPQASLDDLVRSAREGTDGLRRVDFLVAAPWVEAFIVEIDGEGHVPAVDRERDRELAEGGYPVLRVTTEELSRGGGPGLDAVRSSWRPPPPVQEPGVDHVIALAPTLVHQLALAITLAAQHGLLPQDRWVIEVEEPLGLVGELLPPYLDLFSAIDELWQGALMPGRVDLVGRRPMSFVREGCRYRPNGSDRSDRATPDVVIRLEPYLRPTDVLEREHPQPEVVVRPAWLPFRLRPPVFDESERLRLDPGRDVREPLATVLRSAFAKEDFWPGQLEAIRQVLSGGDCAVLLPTGAGKSLIYQLAGLCMPGRTLIVDPTIALMEDQIEGLRANGVDRVAGISKFVVQAGQAEQVLQQVMSGDALFIFVAPERLQQDSFRKTLAALSVTHHVNLAVVDEAHCVSEWGHDFRPAYLGLGSTLRAVCRDSAGDPPPLLALTGTASRTVLLDVLTELGIDPGHEGSLVRPENLDREELEFKVRVAQPDVAEGILRGVIQGLPMEFGSPSGSFFEPRGEATACGIVFCPHVNGRWGVVEVSRMLAPVLHFHPPIFAGTAPKGYDPARFERRKRENARRFRSNEVSVLVATKAFGMGIDKPNVRWVVHYGIPSSMEAYYQEVGRAGRDGRRSVCWLIMTELDPERSRRLLDATAPFEGARGEWERAEDNADDVTRQLWFLYRAFPGQREEYARLRAMVEELKPIGEAREVVIPIGQDESKERERALHRLKVLGVIADYLVDWGSKRFTVRLAEAKPHDVLDSLVAYVERTDPARAGALREELASEEIGDLEQAIEIYGNRLLAFVYERIAGSRRRSLREMWLAARQAAGPQANVELRRRILDYLTEGDISRTLQELLNRSRFAFSDWMTFLSGVAPGPDTRELRGASGRLLSAFPDHPGLLVARGVAEILTPEGDLEELRTNIDRAFGTSAASYGATERDREEAARRLIAIAKRDERCLGTVMVVLRRRRLALSAVREREDLFLREAARAGSAVVALAGRLEDLAAEIDAIVKRWT